VTEESPEDLELQRRLDAAFSETGPRRDFEDLLWARLDPGSRRRRGGWAGLLNRMPRAAWPALASVAAVLVFVIAVLPLLTRGQHMGASSTALQSKGPSGAAAPARGASPQESTLPGPPAAFGSLPTPRLASPSRSPSATGTVVPYFGPATLSVVAGVTSLPVTLPVFRFALPSTRQAATMAADYQGHPLSSSASPFREPRVQITVSTAGPAGVPLADTAALDAADAFLAARRVALPWSHLPEVVDQGSLALVRYARQFPVDGYGLAIQVDQAGAHAGADVAVRPDRKVVRATVPMKLPLQSSAYSSRSSESAAQDALGAPPPSSFGLTPVPQVQLSRADLVYVAMQAGAYGYFEPAILFTGAFTLGGTQYEKRVLVPALDTSNLR